MDRIEQARTLRKNLTSQERKLSYEFLRGYGVKFRRQQSMGPYVLDFYCVSARLAVEVDGGQHYESAGLAYDQKRTAWLESRGIRVIRYDNRQINCEFSAVCEDLDRIVKEILGM